MIDEAQVIALFKEANPIPDVDLLMPKNAPFDHPNIHGKDDNMLKSEERPEATRFDEPKRRPLAILVAAVIVVIILGVGVLNLRGDSEPVLNVPITEPTPTSLAESTPTTPPVDTTIVDLGAQQMTVAAEWLACVATECRPQMAALEAGGVTLRGGLPVEDFVWGQEQSGVELLTIECEPVASGGVTCTRISSDAMGRIWDFEQEEQIRFFFDGTIITGLNWSISHPETVDAYAEWLFETYPDENAQACPGEIGGAPETCTQFIEVNAAEFQASDAWVEPVDPQ